MIDRAEFNLDDDLLRSISGRQRNIRLHRDRDRPGFRGADDVRGRDPRPPKAILVRRQSGVAETAIPAASPAAARFCFVVLDVNTSERHYFDDAALRCISSKWFTITRARHRTIWLRTGLTTPGRFGIDTEELPLPLKSSSLWDNDWDLTSDWFEWRLNRERHE